jgi:hypothetical protein
VLDMRREFGLPLGSPAEFRVVACSRRTVAVTVQQVQIRSAVTDRAGKSRSAAACYHGMKTSNLNPNTTSVNVLAGFGG